MATFSEIAAHSANIMFFRAFTLWSIWYVWYIIPIVVDWHHSFTINIMKEVNVFDQSQQGSHSVL